MNVLYLQVFVSLMLVASAVLALLYSVKQADHEHSDRLSLLPLEPDETHPIPAAPAAKPEVRTPPANQGE
jgi:nitrogen fixation-related uncharacterized protein